MSDLSKNDVSHHHDHQDSVALCVPDQHYHAIWQKASDAGWFHALPVSFSVSTSGRCAPLFGGGLIRSSLSNDRVERITNASDRDHTATSYYRTVPSWGDDTQSWAGDDRHPVVHASGKEHVIGTKADGMYLLSGSGNIVQFSLCKAGGQLNTIAHYAVTPSVALSSVYPASHDDGADHLKLHCSQKPNLSYRDLTLRLVDVQDGADEAYCREAVELIAYGAKGPATFIFLDPLCRMSEPNQANIGSTDARGSVFPWYGEHSMSGNMDDAHIGYEHEAADIMHCMMGLIHSFDLPGEYAH